MKLCLPLILLVAATASADQRINPPTIQEAWPKAVSRGVPTEITLKGINLCGAKSVVFADPHIRAEIKNVNSLGEFVGRFIGSNGTVSILDRGDPAPLHEVTIEITADLDAPLGMTRFQLITENGSTDMRPLSIEPFYGVRPEMEPNDRIPEAMRQEDYIFLPAIVTGSLAEPGDIDYLPFEGVAGEEIVFLVSGPELGSKIRWKLELFNSDGMGLAAKSIVDADSEPVLAYRIPADGKYFLAVSDIEDGGGKSRHYRIRMGRFPYLTSVWPLGVPEGGRTTATLRGYNLGGDRTAAIEGKPAYFSMPLAEVERTASGLEAHNRLKVAVGAFPEVEERDAGADPASAQDLVVPSTVNGRVSGFTQTDGLRADQDFYGFEAKKGERYVIEIEARRLGSPLDSVIEVLDSDGKPISRATVRSLVKTRMVLNDRTSDKRGLRLENLTDLQVGDWVMVGNEIIRVEELPRGPDSDYFFDAVNGKRVAYFDTTPEAHAVDTPVYKVSIHPPHTRFPPNGLPVRQLYYRNDDGGPGYGKDSLLNFTAPADGEYLIRLRDLRGFQGEDFAYRLTVRQARPDFRLSLSPASVSVPAGSAAAVTVSALKLDGFDEPVQVSARDLPPGFRASEGVIFPGETSTVLVVQADSELAAGETVELNVVGAATTWEGETEKIASADNGLRLIATAAPGDIAIEFEDEQVLLQPGKTAEIAVKVNRKNGFTGRVPVSALNLPYGVNVTDIGLNGILITPDQDRRIFKVAALPWVEPQERLITVTGRVETRSPRRQEYAAAPLKLKIQ